MTEIPVGTIVEEHGNDKLDSTASRYKFIKLNHSDTPWAPIETEPQQLFGLSEETDQFWQAMYCRFFTASDFDESIARGSLVIIGNAFD